MNKEEKVKNIKYSSVTSDREEQILEISIWDFFIISFICFLVPLYICLIMFLGYEYLAIHVFKFPLIIHILIFPFLVLLLYLLYILILIEISALWVNRWNKKSPPQEGVFARILKPDTEEGKMLKYYHNRGFIIKYPMWIASKSPFPWLLNRVLKRIGHNKISKNVIYCDSYAGLELTQLDQNVFIYPTSVLSSHAVNSIFGKITIMRIKLGENTVLYPGVTVGSGAITKENYVISPNTLLHKNWRGVPGKKYYRGSPGKPFD
ncbi:MAG: hypothetical protein P8Y70_10780 [Candidatus Lokiarchaeota archaeon]